MDRRFIVATRPARKSTPAPKPIVRVRTEPKQYLMRGADEIPEHWEAASRDDVHGGLLKAITTLSKLAEAATDTPEALQLRRAEKACRRALEHLIGGFSRPYVEPKAKRWKLMVEAGRQRYRETQGARKNPHSRKASPA
jgi:hypothetical protein